MGQSFYDGTMKRLAHAAESIATSLEQLAEREKLTPLQRVELDSTTALLRAALVITKTPTIATWLQDHDPKALEQLEQGIAAVVEERL